MKNPEVLSPEEEVRQNGLPEDPFERLRLQWQIGSRNPGASRNQVEGIIDELTAEHRASQPSVGLVGGVLARLRELAGDIFKFID